MNSKPNKQDNIGKTHFVTTACDFLGITKIEQEAQLVLLQITREIMKETIRLSKKWSEKCGRRKLTPEDVKSVMRHLQGTEFMRNVVAALEKFDWNAEDLLTVPGCQNTFALMNKDVDMEATTNPNEVIPIEPRIKPFFLVTDGKVTKSAYNMNMSDEEDEYEDDFEQLMRIDITMENHVKYSSSCNKLFMERAKSAKVEQVVGLKPITTEILTLEQQLFIKDVITVCMGQDDKKRHEALATLETDAGLQAVLPYLIKMLCKSIFVNISQRCLSLIIYSGRILRSICANKSIDMTMTLHEIFPALLSCMVGRNICLRPESDNHWALRDYSAKTLLAIVKDHMNAEDAPEFRRRIFQFTWRIFKDDESSAPMIYGTIIVLSEFVEPRRIGWLAKEFSEMIGRQKHLHSEMTNRKNGELVASEIIRLIPQLVKYEQALRGKNIKQHSGQV